MTAEFEPIERGVCSVRVPRGQWTDYLTAAEIAARLGEPAVVVQHGRPGEDEITVEIYPRAQFDPADITRIVAVERALRDQGIPEDGLVRAAVLRIKASGGLRNVSGQSASV